jgi:hypothetical protein
MKLRNRHAAFFLTVVLLVTSCQVSIFAAEGPNLVKNPYFTNEEDWVFVNGGTSSGHFYLDENGRVSQIVTIPAAGTYAISGEMATGSGEVDCTFGVKYRDGSIIEEITLESGLNYALKSLGQHEFQQNDQIEVYCTRGAVGNWINGTNISVVDINYVAPVEEPVYHGNLLKNAGFEEGPVEWVFENSSNNYSSGSGIQTNNPHTGSRGFFLDRNEIYAIRQTVTVPFNGLYKTSAYIATGGSNSKFGVRYADGSVIGEIVLPNGATYSAAHALPLVELRQDEEVEIYCKGGSSWTNGDDFVFEYDLSQVSYNLLSHADFSGNPSQMVRVPRDGDYIFTASVTSSSGITIDFDGQTETVPAGEAREISLTTAGKACGDEVSITISGDGVVENAAMLFDLSNIPNEKPIAQNVRAEGIPHSGMALIGAYAFYDPDIGQSEGTTRFRWLSGDLPEGEYSPIQGANGTSLTLNDELENKYIKFEVTPVDSYSLAGDPSLSAPVGPIKINWVRNPSLDIEAGMNPEGWVAKNGGSMPNSSASARTGFRFASIPAGAASAEVSYTIPIERTGRYSAGAWVKTASDGGELGVRLKGSETPLAYVPIPRSEGYAFVSLADVAAERNSEVELYIRGTAGCSAIYADDFQFLIESTEDIPEFASLFSFRIEGQAGDAVINHEEKTIQISMPYGTDVSRLKILAEISEGAVMVPASGTVVDFTNPVVLTIQNGSVSNSWTVTCTVLEQKITLKSDNQLLEEAFNWAVNKTGQFVMTGKHGYVNKDENRPTGTGEADYMPSYWAGYYDRTAFYGRDFVHQAVGAQIVGLKDENLNMFKTFAENATEARKWYTLWAFNFDGTPHTIDYVNDDYFVREVPAQFELVEKAYKQYLWTGDERYINDPVMWNFYTRVMTDYIALHDTNGNGIAEGTARGIFQGSCSYNERGGEPIIEAGDGIGSQYQATLAYAAMLEARGENEAAAQWYEKAAELKRYFNEEWSVYNSDAEGRYARGLTAQGVKYNDFGKENSWFMPMKLITEPGERNDAYLDYISERLADGIGTGPDVPNNIEAYTYIPDTYFPYNRSEDAWKWMKYIINRKDLPHERPSQGTNGDYPEISYTFVSQTMEGLMGVEANAPRHMVATASRLPGEIGWAEADYIMMGEHILNIRHNGLTESTLENTADEGLTWEARFYGDYNAVLVDGRAVRASHKDINGVTVSYALIPVEPGARVKAEAVADYIFAESVELDKTELALKVGESYTLTATVLPETAENKAVEWSSDQPSVAAVENGRITALSRGAAIITATSVDGGHTASCAVTVNDTNSGNDSSGGGNGGTGAPAAAPQPETPKIEISVTGDRVTSAIKAAAAADSEGRATAAVTGTQINEAIEKAAGEAAKHGGNADIMVEIKVEAPANAGAVETRIPEAAADVLADGAAGALRVSTPIASITFDKEALLAISGQAESDVEIAASRVDPSALPAGAGELVGDRPVFDFSVTSGGRSISQFNGRIEISVPYTPKADEDINAIVIYYINDRGLPEAVGNCAYDPAAGTVTLRTSHLSRYAVGYNKVIFKDVDESSQYSDAVGFIAARGITSGTGNGNYGPGDKLTRGQFLVMAMKAYGITPDGNPGDNFADAGSTYYTGYLAEAKRLGISSGIGGNKFAPDKEITRQEMFALLYNVLKTVKELPKGNSGSPLSSFSDAGQIASWAKDAMALLAGAGAVSGNGGRLSPEGIATRAEMAQVLYKLLAK